MKPGSSAVSSPAASDRMPAIDILRGIVMVLMAIDHVRVYSGLPAGGPEPGIFFTRWITHFCAPVFVFLAGTSAFLRRERRGDVSRWLVTRGLLLIALEFTFLRLAWTFNFNFSHLLAGVIWAIGVSMVLLAPLTRLPIRAIAAIGLALLFGHNLIQLWVPDARAALADNPLAGLWQVLYFGGPVEFGENGPQLFVLYSIVPWIGVMAAGFAFGAVLRLPPEIRRRACLRIGLAAIWLFLLLRCFNLYGDPRPWAASERLVPSFLSFLATTKYPASLLFLLMTLGPSIALLPLLERMRGATARVLETFGRVPLFYYVLHIPLIHVVALGVSWLRSGTVDPWLFADHPAMAPPAPDGYTWSLGLLYLVTIGVVAALYPLCRGYAARRGIQKMQGAQSAP